MQEFGFLRTASMIFKVLSWISVVFFVIVALVVLFGAGGPDTPRLASIIFLLGGALYFLLLFTISEVIKILLVIVDRLEQGSAPAQNDQSGQISMLARKVDRLVALLEGKPEQR